MGRRPVACAGEGDLLCLPASTLSCVLHRESDSVSLGPLLTRTLPPHSTLRVRFCVGFDRGWLALASSVSPQSPLSRPHPLSRHLGSQPEACFASQAHPEQRRALLCAHLRRAGSHLWLRVLGVTLRTVLMLSIRFGVPTHLCARSLSARIFSLPPFTIWF